jgi:hypothetical protein
VKTVVYQSYRTSNVPAWISRCMGTVQQWAAAHGFDYRFIDDQLFSYAPEWYRQKVSDNILPVSDLARLVLARQFLREGYARTVWIDADCVVFRPKQFSIDVTEDYAFCHELWVVPAAGSQWTGHVRVNNAITIFVEPNDFLDFYIHACKVIVQKKSGLDNLDVGTRFLTGLHKLMPFTLIRQVGAFSPILMAELGLGRVAAVLQAYTRGCGSPIHAANLCSSFRNTCADGVSMNDDLYNSVVENLLNLSTE